MKNIVQKLGMVMAATFVAAPAFAQTADGGGHGLIGLAAGLAIGLSALGAALGQSKAASAGLDGIARNPAAEPKIFKSLILSLILIETMAIYGFVVAFLLIGKF